MTTGKTSEPEGVVERLVELPTRFANFQDPGGIFVVLVAPPQGSD